MADPHNVIHGLPLMTFRGLEAPPYDDASFGFSHTQGERPYPYINGAAHDHVGFDPQRLSFTLYFLNTVGGVGMFPDLWELWWKELQDGSPGELVHPILGPRMVVVQGGDVTLQARTTAGVVARVAFSTTILDPENEEQFEAIKVNVKELAKKADAAAKEVSIPFPSEAPATDLLDLGKQIEGFLLQAELLALGLISKAESIIGGMIDTADKLGHVGLGAHDALVALWNSFEDLKEKVGAKQARPTGAVVVDHDTTLDAFARERKNTLAEVMGLNVAALEKPIVPAGTMLRYYQ